MAQALFISETILKDRSLISDNVDIKYIRETTLYCQDVYIQKLTGTTLFQLLITQITAGTLTNVNTTLLNDYIQPILVWRVTAESAYWTSNKLMNKGVMNQSSENSQSVSRSVLDAIANKANDKAEYYEQRMIDYLCENSTLYPTYDNPASGVDVIHPNRGTAFTSSIHLESSPRPKSMRARYNDEQISLD